jgi:alkylation response protein AidB-like acyl-CoA dehydrogenase
MGDVTEIETREQVGHHSTHGSVPDAAGLTERVRALLPAIAAAAPAAERARKVDDRVMKDLERTGVFRAYVPRRFGGYEIDIDTFIDVGVEVGSACTSTGWITTFYMEHNWLLGHFAPEAQREIFAAQPYVLAPGAISLNGRAKGVAGGHELSGRWQWGTGIMHADWVMVSGIIEVSNAAPEARLFLIPRAKVEVVDTWYASGMCATGSNDIVADRVFVPAHLSQDLVPMGSGESPGAAWLGSATYRYPMIPFLALTAAAPLVGAARGATELFEARLGERRMFGTTTRQADKPAAQIRLAHLVTRTRAVEDRLRGIGAAIVRWAEKGEPCAPVERARLRLAVAHVVAEARAIVRDVADASGATAQLSNHALQRFLRDVGTGASHAIFDLDTAGELYGRLRLGLDARGLI